MNNTLFTIGYGILRTLVFTWRIKVNEQAPVTELKKSGKRMVYSVWHDHLLMGFKHWQHTGLVAPTSQSKDGEIISRILEKFGYTIVRGSSSRGAVQALLAAKRRMDEGKRDGVITVDGPKGPRHEVKPGVVFLAKKTDQILVPVVFNCNRYWQFGSWDKIILPKPFATITVTYGEPLFLSDDTGKEAVDADIQTVESRMLELTRVHCPRIV